MNSQRIASALRQTQGERLLISRPAASELPPVGAAAGSARGEPVEPHIEPEGKYPNSFGCGADNPIGLRLQYRREGDALVTEFTPGEEHEGWRGIVHGGIITTLFYEVMENFAYLNGTVAMMRDMNARFRSPAKIGEPIIAIARLGERAGREMSVSATLTQGKLIAEGSAQLVALRQEQIKRLGIT